jgi:hypothetical protein
MDATWTPLGAGTRVGTASNWQLAGLSLPANPLLRARGRTSSSGGNVGAGGSGLVETPGYSYAAPDIAVAQASALADGAGSVDFGVVNPGVSTAAKTFTITNPGTADLASLAISLDGANAGDFTVSALDITYVKVGPNYAKFTVTFTPSASGPRSAALHTASNVIGSKNPFDIALTGTGNTPPVLSLPASPVAVEATSYSATVVNFTVTANDAEDGVLTPNLSNASGSGFHLGDTIVHVDATDSTGTMVSGSFIVRVVDTIAPVVTPPANMTVHSPSPNGVFANYPNPTVTEATGEYYVTFSPPRYALLPVGTTTVTVTATDLGNNVGTATFTVTVTPPTSLENWRYAKFGTTDNFGNSADNADPYRTGIQNLAVFALLGPNQDPATANGGMIPQAHLMNGNYFYSFDEPTGVNGVTYGAEWSATLEPNDWHTITDTSTTLQHHFFSVPSDSNTPRLFLRLKVTEQ